MSALVEVETLNLIDIVTAVEVLDEGISGDDARNVIGGSAFETVYDYLVAIAADTAHHKTSISLGAERTGFYEKAAGAVEQPQLVPDGVAIRIPHRGLAQRYYGGLIEMDDKMLTIPARAETYGRRAGEFDNLRVIMFPSGSGALVERKYDEIGQPLGGVKVRGRRGGKERAVPAIDKSGSDVYFWLLKSVFQEADETVLPSDEAIADPAIIALQEYIGRIWDERQAA